MDEMLFKGLDILVTDLFDIHQDWNVPIPGFFIIASKMDINSIGEMNVEEAKEYGLLLGIVRQAMLEALGIKTVYVFQREDSSHGFHTWLFPRYDWMDKFGTGIESVRPAIAFATAHYNEQTDLGAITAAVQKMRAYFNYKPAIPQS